MKLTFSVNSSPSPFAINKSHQIKFPLDIFCSVNLSSLPSQYNWCWWCQSCFICHMSPTKYACGNNFIHGELFIHQACGCSHSKWSCTMIDSSSFWNSKLNFEPNWGQHVWLIAPPFKTLERKVSLHPLSDGVWLVNSQREANLQFLENTISTTTQLSQTYHKAQVVKVVFSLFQIATVKGPNKRRNKMLWPSDFLLLFLCGSISTSAKHYKDQKVPKRKCHLPCHGEVVVLYSHTYGHINHTF